MGTSVSVDNTVVAAMARATVPRRLVLARIHPNPFSGATSISFGLPAAVQVRLAVYDLTGKLVRMLQDGPLSAGYHRVQWDVRDWRGQTVGSGKYLCKITAGEESASRHMVVVR